MRLRKQRVIRHCRKRDCRQGQAVIVVAYWGDQVQVRQTYIGVNDRRYACRDTAAMSRFTDVGPCSRIISWKA